MQEQNIFWPHIQEGENEQKLTSVPPQRLAQAGVKKKQQERPHLPHHNWSSVVCRNRLAGNECPRFLLFGEFKFPICRQKQLARLCHLYYLQHPLKTKICARCCTYTWGKKKSFLVPKCLPLSTVFYLSLKTLQLHGHFQKKNAFSSGQNRFQGQTPTNCQFFSRGCMSHCHCPKAIAREGEGTDLQFHIKGSEHMSNSRKV